MSGTDGDKNGGKSREKSVPKTRASRFGRMARLAGGVAAGMMGEGIRQLSQGQRPQLSNLALTPKNARRLTEQLSAMRGAAMKLGQMLSMETADFLPKELADILSQLRSQAYQMPATQLEKVMSDALGENWRSRFAAFNDKPMAAASIGQVHRAETPSGDSIVVKVQYPGVAQSIDSDVDNLATLLRLTSLLPAKLDISRLLRDTKKQLHEEADYHREAQYLKEFGEQLADDERFVVPHVFLELSAETVLAMSYVQGEPIESLIEYEQDVINDALEALFALLFKEFFELQLMQTDPNFANYLYQSDTDRLVLLDFGATRHFSKTFVVNYKRLLRAVIAGDEQAMIDAAMKVGYLANDSTEDYQRFLVDVFSIFLEPFATEGVYDFSQARLTKRLSAASEAMMDFRSNWQAPPTDAVYLHRKVGGLFMLAMRLGAQVDVNAMLKPYLTTLKV
ncbi:MAG: ubiquinol-cytochrome C reductase [Gammaproteobacteria bacterium]|nr:MAG: ubiquinol-cytochrome C reductase [Gammaproteobacteria bacterium]